MIRIASRLYSAILSGVTTLAGNLIPDADITRDLGSTTKRWSQLWVATVRDANSNARLSNLGSSSSGTNYRGAIADGSTAIAHAFGNTATLSNATAKIAAFYPDSLSTEKLGVYATGKLGFEYTDGTGSPGNATVNKVSGKNAIAASASAAVITNSTVTANSIIMITPLDTDATLVRYKAVPSAGSFTVTGNTTATATWKFSWLVIND